MVRKGKLEWNRTDLRLCTVNAQKYFRNKYCALPIQENVLKEFDHLDPKIVQDIFRLMRDLGVPEHIDAITYLSETIAYCVMSGRTQRVNTLLFPVIAKRRNISVSTIDKSISQVLRPLFQGKLPETFRRIFKTELPAFLGSGWFINRVTNWYLITYKISNTFYTDDRERIFAKTDNAG